MKETVVNLLLRSRGFQKWHSERMGR